MAEQTGITWCDSTFNPWIGCTKVSPGCDHCYAEARMDKRLHLVQWGPQGERKRTKTWGDPIKWNAAHDAFFAQHGRRRRVFCASLADVFDNAVPAAWRADLWQLIIATPNLDWLLLTKRIGNAMGMLYDAEEPLPNVWLGASIVNQAEADRDIPKLLATPAARRFLSCEPLLGPLDLQRPCTACCENKGACFPGAAGERLVVDSESGGYTMECICSRLNGLHWVIVGGESGPQARPMHPDWARSLRDQCEAASVPFFFKQWGEWAPNDRTFAEVEASDRKLLCVGLTKDLPYPAAAMDRVGKAAAGDVLDGRLHHAWPLDRP